MMLKIKAFVYVGVLSLFLFPREAHAYLDPGTGSYLFQFVIAGLLGSVFFFRGYFDKIKNKLTGKKEEGKEENTTKDEKTNKPTKGKGR